VNSGTTHLHQTNRSPSRSKIRNPVEVRLQESGSPGRRRLERAIAEKFSRVHGAHINEFLPYLLSLGTEDHTTAIAGLRLAGNSPLFLEQYLDRPVEQAISREFRVPVDRGQVVEIGNLVSVRPGAASALFALLPAILHSAGIRWVACTATPAVRALLSGLDFPWRSIADADPNAVNGGVDKWGSYYASGPTVIAGSVEAALRNAQATMPFALFDQDRAQRVSDIAGELRAARA
jgi:hypothetical protein